MKDTVQPSPIPAAAPAAPDSANQGTLFRSEAGPFALVVIVSMLLLFGLIHYYGNVNRGTANGLWKSIPMQKWVDKAPDRYTDAANQLYYPTYGFLVRQMPEGVFGPTWRRMAFLNAVFASINLGVVYLLARKLFDSRPAGLYTAAFQLSCAFFLLLATINEDIMPGYTCFFAAILCLVFYAGRPGWIKLFLAAQFFALSWLFQSFLMYPAIPAALLALLSRPFPLKARIGSAVAFLIFLIPLPLLCARSVGLSWQSGFWTNKGLGTGWGGFAVNKLIFMWGGIAEYFAGGENVHAVDDLLAPARIVSSGIKWAVIAALFCFLVVCSFSRRARADWRCASVTLVLCFFLGQGMNLYIQPQDPQMQIQPMAWLALGWGCFAAWLLGLKRQGLSRGLVHGLLTAGLAALFAGNVAAYNHVRHRDTLAIENARKLEAVADPRKTVFVAQAFEGLNTWLTVMWGAGPILPNDPNAKWGDARNFKIIYLASEATVFPARPPEESAQNLVRIIDDAIQSGYQVVSTDVFEKSRTELIASFSTVSTAEKPGRIYDALHEHFQHQLLIKLPGWGNFYRITRAVKSQSDPESNKN